ncbi:MAG TPA: hypothetical protein VGU44_02285 [Gammaproteobacteria bacterium]|nr:hypothetical protein [Gammaproteobacteria bacterium]
MPTNAERDDLVKPTLREILKLKDNPDKATKTLSTEKQAIANEVNKILKPFGIELKNDPNKDGKQGSTFSATLTNEAAAQAMNQLNKNPILQAMGQGLAQKMGQTPGAQQSTTPTPFNKTGTPQFKRD